MPRTPSASPSLRFRVLLGNGHAIGPGKIELLEAIATAGSISAAGRELAMSYKRAWQLVDDLNKTFATPVVQTSKGGGRGGGATLTPTGVRVLAAYRAIERKALKLAAAELNALNRLLE